MTRQIKNHAITIAIIVFTISIWQNPLNVFAWSDNSENGRPSYTKAEISQLVEEGKWGNKIVFNSISDSVIGDEKNFVGARQCIQRADGSWEGTTENTIWKANEITVEDGKTYIIRAYVHNNNPNGYNGVAKDTKISFNVPGTSAKEVKVNGFISSSNATPSEYEDNVIFKSDTENFHLDYIYGSALLENNQVGLGGCVLGDEIVNAKTGGVLIGYDDLNGEVPGYYQYDNFVSIKVKVVFDYDFIVENKVRLADDPDRTWKDTLEAKIGDKVEFLIQYKNNSNYTQEHAAIKNTLPNNLRYVAGSTMLKNGNYPNGAQIVNDDLVGDGLRIGSYGAGSNAYLKFTAEVVDNDLGYGHNVLINWTQAGVGDTTRRASTSITLTKKNPLLETMIMICIVLIVLCLVSIPILFFKIIRLKRSKNFQKR